MQPDSSIHGFLKLWNYRPGAEYNAEQEAVITALFQSSLELSAAIRGAYDNCLLAESKLENGLEIRQLAEVYLKRIVEASSISFSNDKAVKAAKSNLAHWELEIDRLNTHLRLAKVELARVMGIDDSWREIELSKGVRDADLVIVCTPVETIADFATEATKFGLSLEEATVIGVFR